MQLRVKHEQRISMNGVVPVSLIAIKYYKIVRQQLQSSDLTGHELFQ